MLWRLAGGILLQERLDPEASPLVLCEDVMLCWSPWTCGLLVRTGVCEDYYRTVRRSGRQVGFILFRMLRDLWFSVSKVTLIRIVLAIFFFSQNILCKPKGHPADSGHSHSLLY